MPEFLNNAQYNFQTTGCTIPRAVRVAEIDSYFQVLAEFCMTRHFLALVVGEACSHLLGDAAQRPLKAIERGVRPAVLHFHQDRETALALHQGSDRAGVACALDQIAFPVAEEFAGQNRGGTLVDGGHAHKAAAPVLALPAGAAQLLALTQEPDEFTADFAARQHVDHLVNRLVRDSANRFRHARQSARYLLRRPALADMRDDVLAKNRPLAQFDQPAPSPPARRAPGANRLIAARIATVARHFPTDCRGRSAQLLGYRTKTSTDAHLLLNEIPLKSVNVFESLSHENTHYPAGCCTSNLRPPTHL